MFILAPFSRQGRQRLILWQADAGEGIFEPSLVHFSRVERRSKLIASVFPDKEGGNCINTHRNPQNSCNSGNGISKSKVRVRNWQKARPWMDCPFSRLERRSDEREYTILVDFRTLFLVDFFSEAADRRSEMVLCSPSVANRACDGKAQRVSETSAGFAEIEYNG